MFQPELETMPRDELETLQLERLRATLRARVRQRARSIARSSTTPASTPRPSTSLADLARVPFTVKDDLRVGVPVRHVRRAAARHRARPLVLGHHRARSPSSATRRATSTAGADLMARTYASAGATADDIVQVTYGYGLFTGGLGAHYGSERLGALTIPVSGGNTKRQVQILKDFGVTVLACTPSYALLIGETAAGDGHRRSRPAAAGRRVRRGAVEREHAQADRGRARTSPRSTSTACRR